MQAALSTPGHESSQVVVPPVSVDPVSAAVVDIVVDASLLLVSSLSSPQALANDARKRAVSVRRCVLAGEMFMGSDTQRSGRRRF